ncbi:MAG: hypothetical protein KF824_05410 [Fimbriimonadaceae bacterium]|nr:MAG: hypothetical protein KF824_05410 [Fimbriimonadaceae bacterium]
MTTANFKEVVSRATEIVLASQLQSVLNDCDLSEVLSTIEYLRKTIFSSIDPHFVSGSLFLRNAPQNSTIRGSEVTDMSIFVGRPVESLVFELHVNRRLFYFDGATFDAKTESESALVYEYKNRTDLFWFNSNDYVVPATDPNADSQFCGRTFFDISLALQEYARKYAYPCKCPTLSSAWFDDTRTYFKAEPEATLRDSLKHFLDVHLSAGYDPDFEVRAEQNMDSSHPTDIKVTKQLQPRVMIIEVKWLGDSMNKLGTDSTVSHRDAKAIEGARQLGTYLDANLEQAPHISSVGYYVIFDGRRRGLKVGRNDYSDDELLHFENVEIDFGDIDVLKRSDFTTPLRMFIRPKLGEVGSRAGKR